MSALSDDNLSYLQHELRVYRLNYIVRKVRNSSSDTKNLIKKLISIQ